MFNGLATTLARQSEAARLGLKAKYTPSLRSRFLWQFRNEYLKEIFNKELRETYSWFHLTWFRYVIGLENPRHPLNQSDALYFAALMITLDLVFVTQSKSALT